MDQQEQQLAEQIFNTDYWNKPAFHVALDAVPFKQNDADGRLVVNVHDHFFKLDGDQLVMARVPEDLSLPQQWEPVPDRHPMRNKALSMIGPMGVA